eukprot:487984-Pelagomonas_calceolata.AAC.5
MLVDQRRSEQAMPGKTLHNAVSGCSTFGGRMCQCVITMTSGQAVREQGNVKNHTPRKNFIAVCAAGHPTTARLRLRPCLGTGGINLHGSVLKNPADDHWVRSWLAG